MWNRPAGFLRVEHNGALTYLAAMAPTADERLARARLALEGLSVGDAFGEKFFINPDAAVMATQERWLPVGRWRWTDDTAMALSIVEVLGEIQQIDWDRLAAAFARRWAADAGRGYGAGAHRILEAIRAGTPWQLAARSVFRGNGSMGNGAAMRAAPIGAYFAHDLERVASETRKSAVVTHAHLDGIAGGIAVAVAAAAAHVHRGRADAPTLIMQAVLEWTPESDTRSGLQQAATIPAPTPVTAVAQQLGCGDQVLAQDTVPFSVWCACRHLGSYEEALWQTVSALGDRDTTCAIVGGIVAMNVGLEGIPVAWVAAREELPGASVHR